MKKYIWGNAKPEVYRTMNEIFGGKITGKYLLISQGYLLYSVIYINKKTKEVTNYEIKNIKLNNINCL